MRAVKIFAGSSHPGLTNLICERLGVQPSRAELSKFSNGETSVKIGTSVRDQDVFIVQSGSAKINDSIMELLIMISACKGGSARSITAVMPYFPYSRSSKKKSHRGAITARMLANLLSIAGVHHVITVDLHAPPMQGFFGQPVDNLRAEPLIARWIRLNIKDWPRVAVVSKSAGGSKRVTSLADKLKVNFGIITTDERRATFGDSFMAESNPQLNRPNSSEVQTDEGDDAPDDASDRKMGLFLRTPEKHQDSLRHGTTPPSASTVGQFSHSTPSSGARHAHAPHEQSPLHVETRALSGSPPSPETRRSSRRVNSSSEQRAQELPPPPVEEVHEELESPAEEFTDERAKEVVTARLIQGHIVDDDHPSPVIPSLSASTTQLPALGRTLSEDRDFMTSSFMSVGSSLHRENTMGGTYDGAELSDHEEDRLVDPDLEHTVTLVGTVSDRTVILIDDIMDRSESWIAAAETVVKRGGANQVYCMATHGIFGGNALAELEDCDCIDHIVVCNTFPIDLEKAQSSRKLEVLDLSSIISEAIRRNHFGESVTQLYRFYGD